MGNFEIVTLKTGIKSLRCQERRETFHPVTGPRAEANILHVEQQRLVERCVQASSKFVIWDVGFGAAANALAVIEALSGLADGPPIELHSFDRTLEALEFALEHSGELGYLEPHRELLLQLLADREVRVSSRLSWKFQFGDFRELLLAGKPLPAPNSILYDPYSPATNPEMWTLDHFQRLRSRLEPESPCLLTNYTRSTAVRATLLLAGFAVGVGRSVGEKAETTIASNDASLLLKPLQRSWINRVRISRNSAPMRRAEAYSQAPMNPSDLELLEAAPQFN